MRSPTSAVLACTSDEDEDRLLVERYLTGDREAFTALVVRYQRAVYNAAFWILRKHEDANDISQTVFLKVAERARDYDPKYKFFSWLYRIAVNESLNLQRRHRHEEELDDVLSRLERASGFVFQRGSLPRGLKVGVRLEDATVLEALSELGRAASFTLLGMEGGQIYLQPGVPTARPRSFHGPLMIELERVSRRTRQGFDATTHDFWLRLALWWEPSVRPLLDAPPVCVVTRAVDDTGETYDFGSWLHMPVRTRDDGLPIIGSQVRVPRVLHLLRYDRAPRIVVRLTRRNLMIRDQYQCQYCGRRPTLRELNVDHVIPRSRGGQDSWENLVVSCRTCNLRKGRRTPVEASMTLLSTPHHPRWSTATQIRLATREPFAEWQPFLQTG